MARELIVIERPPVPQGSLDGASPVNQMKAIYIMMRIYEFNLKMADLVED